MCINRIKLDLNMKVRAVGGGGGVIWGAEQIGTSIFKT